MVMCPYLKWIYLTSIVLGAASLSDAQKQQKRQIYREQVLPALGGKIPEDAFRTDRLALNRLNKEGITVVDGVLLQARDHDKNPDAIRSKPEIIQVYVSQDTRYVPPEGRYRNDRPKSVDTTYVIRKPIGSGNRYGNHLQRDERPAFKVSPSFPSRTDHHPRISYSPNKAHGYANFHRFVEANDRYSPLHHQSPNRHNKIIYKPIVTPLVFPTSHRPTIRGQINDEHNDDRRITSWEVANEWLPFYQRSPVFLDTSDLFLDSHQIFTDYGDFFNNFHGRSYRHVDSSSAAGNGNRVANDGIGDRAISLALPAEKSPAAYTELTSIPETSFSCDGRTGIHADAETKCQVFHDCSGWTKRSSLCPVGTAYSTITKRCEWWNAVNCASE